MAGELKVTSLRGWAIMAAALVSLALSPPARVLLGQEDVAEAKASKTPIDTTPIRETPISAGDRKHWSFAPIMQQELPSVKDAAWLRTGVDSFVLAKLEAKGVGRAAEAERTTLLRRLTFDITGVPPKPAELAAYESDQSPDAYERQVDRLLAAPAFGERWGQYWLDLARFAETDGYEHDKVRPNAWRYRDWVIAALNADMRYDEFVRLQLDGDEEAGATVATMFCLSGTDMPDINDQAERRHSLMNELTGTVGAAFLGLQVGCAQCHDHKYDPLSQADFYRLRAVFEPAVPALKRDVPVSALANQKDAAPARLWVRGDHRRPGLEVQPGFPRIASADTPTRRASEAAATTDENPSLARRVSMRAELAAWLFRDDNPLTSRVIANRVWQHHFGRGICETPSDFGTMSGAVTHPELLDRLAGELRHGGWELKRLHRLIVSSATYREAGRISDATADPENLLYSHFPRHRLDGEAIRDAMLATAGLLTSERGGPGVMPPLPDELVGTLLKGQWTESKREADHYKRSVYVFARRNLRYPIFEAFDRPDGNASCPIRNRSTTAPQSLQLFNSEFSLQAARHLAGRVLSDANEPHQQIERLYRIALSRSPSAAELKALQSFLTEERERLASEARPRDQLALPEPCPASADPHAAAALVDACLAVLNASEFIYVD